MIRWDPELEMWRLEPQPVLCPLCASPMLRYENPDRWLCFNIKMHDKAITDADRLPCRQE